MAKKPTIAFAGVPSVNLLPRGEIERRERVALTRGWVIGAFGAILVACLLVAAGVAVWFSATQRLAAELTRGDELSAELVGYSEVSNALADVDSLESFRSEAMSADFAWSPVFQGLAEAVPSSSKLVRITLAPGSPPEGDAESSVGATGQLTFATAKPGDQAVIVAALAALPEVLAIDAREIVSAGEGAYEYSVAIELDQTIYSNAYAEGDDN